MNHDVTAYGASLRPQRLLGQRFLHHRSICPGGAGSTFTLPRDWWMRTCVTMRTGMLVLIHRVRSFRGFFAHGSMFERNDEAWTGKCRTGLRRSA